MIPRLVVLVGLIMLAGLTAGMAYQLSQQPTFQPPPPVPALRLGPTPIHYSL